MHEFKNKFSSVELVKIQIAVPDAWGKKQTKKHSSVCNHHSTKLCRHMIYVIFSKMWLRHLNNSFK